MKLFLRNFFYFNHKFRFLVHNTIFYSLFGVQSRRWRKFIGNTIREINLTRTKTPKIGHKNEHRPPQIGPTSQSHRQTPRFAVNPNLQKTIEKFFTRAHRFPNKLFTISAIISKPKINIYKFMCCACAVHIHLSPRLSVFVSPRFVHQNTRTHNINENLYSIW